MNIFSFRSKPASNGGGATYEINGRSYRGNSIHIDGDGSVTVDGVKQDGGALVGPVSVHVTGDAEHVETRSGDITISGSAGSVSSTSGDIQCGNVAGSVSAVSGDVRCGAIGGSVSTVSGDITD